MLRIPAGPVLLLSISMLCSGETQAADSPDHVAKYATQYRADIAPIVTRHCAECHSGPEAEAGVVLDRFSSDDELLRPQLWVRVLKNVRAGIMPPAPAKGLSPEEL